MDQQPENQKYTQYHLKFMTKLSNKIAVFFDELAQICIKELYERTDQKQQQKQPSIHNHRNGDILPSEKSYSSKSRLEDKQSNPDIQMQEQVKKTKKGRPAKVKSIVVANKPKAPTSSFLLFLHQHKKSIASKYQENSTSKLTKLASQVWKNLPQIEKNKYNERSNVEKERYHNQMAQYKKKFSEEIKEEKRMKQAQYRNKWLHKKKGNKLIQQKIQKINNLPKTPSNNIQKVEQLSSQLSSIAESSSSSSSSSSASNTSQSKHNKKVYDLEEGKEMEAISLESSDSDLLRNIKQADLVS